MGPQQKDTSMTNAFPRKRPGTRAARFTTAVAAAQQMLRDQVASGRKDPPHRPSVPTIDGVPATGEATSYLPAPRSLPGPDWLRFVPVQVRGIVESHLPAGLPDVSGPLGHGYVFPHTFPRPAIVVGDAVPEGAQFLTRTFSNQAGSRPYKLYVPSFYKGQPIPLVVMLHGCTQSPDDFAAGTDMNAIAEEQVCLVAYPGQTSNAQAQKCWKWFSADNQQRDQGEPSLIAGITRQVMRDYAVDPHRVYVAGLSAGGAAAAIMGETYPDLYAAIGVHSGLACGSAHDLPSALAAMKRGRSAAPAGQLGVQRRVVPTIVFHGDRDTTVAPRNGDEVIAQSMRDAAIQTRVRKGQVPGGHAYSCKVYSDETGEPVTEQWVIHGAGHAWSGGSAAGSYTDPHGPDASREMMRFFREHPHSAIPQEGCSQDGSAT